MSSAGTLPSLYVYIWLYVAGSKMTALHNQIYTMKNPLSCLEAQE